MPIHKSLLFITISVLFAVSANAQMRSGEQMKNYSDVFGVEINQRNRPFDLTLIDSNPAGNILVPGEQPALTFLLKNNLDQPLTANGKFNVIAYGTRGIPGDIWLPELYKIADLPAISAAINVLAKGSQVLTVKAKLPETFGAYALVLDLGSQGKTFATTCVRTFSTAPGKIQYPKLSLDDSVGAEVLKKLGVQAIRMQCSYTPTTHPDYAKDMARLDEELKVFANNNITVLLMFMSGKTDQPLGRTRPHLNDEGIMLNTKEDMAWMPKDDPDFQKFVAAICKKYGWPKGPITAVELWNEPWEGISISGWGADMPRFREIYTAMAQGVEEARQTGVSVLITGCDSVTNTLDKLFPDGKDTFLKWLDACTIHYQGICAPVLYKQWINRQGPNGRVKIWDTESWVANTDDRVATVIATNRAAGYDRSMGVFSGNISTPIKRQVTLPDGTKKPIETYQVWSTAAAIGAAQHFIGERNFRELLFTNGLPWVMIFDGEKNPEDGTVVIVGDLKEAFGESTHFHNVRGMVELKHKEALTAKLSALAADSPERAGLQKQLATPEVLSQATLTLKNPGQEFVPYDFYGNKIDANGESIKIPLDHRGYFLRSNGKPGSFARLIEALKSSRIDGYEPLNIAAHDLLAPIVQKPELHLTLTNILNRPVSGTLTVSLGKLKLNAPAKLDFQPHETKELKIAVSGGEASPDNTYPLSFRFDAGTDGYSTLQENLHVNLIAKRTISIDGNLDDWKNVLPQAVYASGGQGPSLMEAAWLPFDKFSTSQQPGFATAYLAYDDKNFYFAAKIADNSPDPGTIRYEKRNDDDYYYPEVSYEYNREKTLLKTDETWSEPSRKEAALLLPDSKQHSFTAWSSVADNFAVDLSLPAPQLVSFYFVDWDSYQFGRRVTQVEVLDANGKKLAQTTMSEYGSGAYATFRLDGKVRVLFKNLSKRTWLSASVSGIFFDANDGGNKIEFLHSDSKTGANWQAKYGKLGYHIIGNAPKYPAGVTISVPENVVKTEYRWPEGVRRYTYRKRPDLPFGSSPKFDNVQLAFNVIPANDKPDMIPFPPGTMDGFIPRGDTDYEYALNKVADANGGGTEIWRSQVPGMPGKNFYPRQPASPFDGPVKDGKLVVKYDGNTRIVEAAIPWSEIPLVQKCMLEDKPVKFTFRVNDNQGPAMELASSRSVSKKNPYTLHPSWVEHWANEVEFSFEK
ncbi:MAG: hypothetical protein LBH01_11400 [Verrucomicrobiales bacterium]|jgi:hypothetical protein|nr:hypothetical protein [Verrucomicrobiales bacterium]